MREESIARMKASGNSNALWPDDLRALGGNIDDATIDHRQNAARIGPGARVCRLAHFDAAIQFFGSVVDEMQQSLPRRSPVVWFSVSFT